MYTTLPPIQLDFSLSQDQITQAQTLVRNFLRKKFFPTKSTPISKANFSPEQIKEREQYTKEDAEMIRELRKSPGRHEDIKNDLKKNKAFFSQFPTVTVSGK